MKRLKLYFYLIMFDFHVRMMCLFSTSIVLENYHDRKSDDYYLKMRELERKLMK